MSLTQSEFSHCLERNFAYRFRDAELATLAITHRSVAKKNNERLEFLGDAVLDAVVSARLLELLPTASEGELSRQRAALVNERSLAGLGVDISLGSHLILGSGERKTGGHRRDSILADAVEAILGAIFLDGGYDAAQRAIECLFSGRFDNLPNDTDLKDPKTRLQEWLQERGLATPEYEVISVSGKPHQQKFEISCEISERNIAVKATGNSRRKAEQSAASQMLATLKN